MNVIQKQKQLRPGQLWVLQSRPAGQENENWIEDVRGMDPEAMIAAVAVWANPLREHRMVARKIRKPRRSRLDRQGKVQYDFVSYNN